jgi:hypothetical protein
MAEEYVSFLQMTRTEEALGRDDSAPRQHSIASAD